MIRSKQRGKTKQISNSGVVNFGHAYLLLWQKDF